MVGVLVFPMVATISEQALIMLLLIKKSIKEAIPSQNTVHRSVMRFDGCVSVITIAIYVGHGIFIIGLAILLIIIFPSFEIYLAIKFKWMRAWLAINTASYSTFIYIAISEPRYEKWYLWFLLPFILSIFTHLYFDKYLKQLGREFGIPREIGQENSNEDLE